MPDTRRSTTRNADRPDDSPAKAAAPKSRSRSGTVGAKQASQAPAALAPRSWVGRAWRAALLLAVAATVTVGLVIGWPIVYERYIAPVDTNTADLGAIRDRLAELQDQLDSLAAGQDRLDARMADEIANHDVHLAELDAMARTLGSTDDAAAAEAVREITVLRAMELMSRSRLFMYESNFGQAEQDVQAAYDLLASVNRGTATTDYASIRAAAQRLDRVAAALPDFPVVASDDLDIAWQALLGEVPPSPTPSPTPAPTAAASVSATESPAPSP